MLNCRLKSQSLALKQSNEECASMLFSSAPIDRETERDLSNYSVDNTICFPSSIPEISVCVQLVDVCVAVLVIEVGCIYFSCT